MEYLFRPGADILGFSFDCQRVACFILDKLSVPLIYNLCYMDSSLELQLVRTVFDQNFIPNPCSRHTTNLVNLSKDPETRERKPLVTYMVFYTACSLKNTQALACSTLRLLLLSVFPVKEPIARRERFIPFWGRNMLKWALHHSLPSISRKWALR